MRGGRGTRGALAIALVIAGACRAGAGGATPDAGRVSGAARVTGVAALTDAGPPAWPASPPARPIAETAPIYPEVPPDVLARCEAHDLDACLHVWDFEEVPAPTLDAAVAAARAACRRGDAGACRGVALANGVSPTAGDWLSPLHGRADRVGGRAALRHAIHLWTDACARRGDAAACTEAGIGLQVGVAVSADLDGAIRLFERGCRGGDARACVRLAEISEPDGARPDPRMVEVYAARVCAMGDPACLFLTADGRAYFGALDARLDAPRAASRGAPAGAR